MEKGNRNGKNDSQKQGTDGNSFPKAFYNIWRQY